ncbi:hypothetical protein AMECASPLE_013281, partial [Ameca splendens]
HIHPPSSPLSQHPITLQSHPASIQHPGQVPAMNSQRQAVGPCYDCASRQGSTKWSHNPDGCG